MTFTSTSPVPAYTLTTLHQDLFTRANTSEPTIGGPDIGGAWTLLGASWDPTPAYGYIQSNKMTTSVVGSAATSYLCTQLSGIPRMMELKGSWNTGGATGADGAFTVRVGLAPVDFTTYMNWGLSGLHVRLQKDFVYVDYLDDINPYTHNLDSAAISPALSQAGAEHTFKIYLYPETGTVEVFVNGVSKLSVTHAKFKSEADGGSVGPYVYWQLYYGAEDSAKKVFLTGATAYSNGDGFIELAPVAKSNSTTFDNTSPVAIAQP